MKVPISRIDRRVVYVNQWVEVVEDKIDRSGHDGIYAVVHRPDAATIVLRSPTGKILMLNSFRYPTGEFSFELPMGGVDPGEDPLDAARRELAEETGIGRQVSLSLVGTFFALPGLSDQRVFVFHGDASDELMTGAHEPSDVDLIGMLSVDVGDIPDLVAGGRITDSLTLCSLGLAGLALTRSTTTAIHEPAAAID